MYVDTYNKSVSFLFHPVIADIYSFVNISWSTRLSDVTDLNIGQLHISWSTKLNYIILRTERARTERAPTGQQAHSPGQRAAAPREPPSTITAPGKGKSIKTHGDMKKM